MKNTGGGPSCLNVNNEIHNRIIYNTVRAGFLDSNQHTKHIVVQCSKSTVD